LIALTSTDGVVQEKYAYDPWGKRRNPDNWSQDDTRANLILDRGYTMHEHLDAFNLINMNGRVYDPQLGMFLSPDPYIQSPGNWLNYIRYGYCLNNPLKYTDPSGEFFFTALLSPVGLTALGVIIDGACWGAVIGGGAYSVSTAMGQGGFDNWSWTNFGNSVLAGAASGSIFAGMGLIAPSFTAPSTSFANNIPTYFGKASYAALSGGLSSGTGMLIGDYLDDGEINTPFEDYLKGMRTAAFTSGLLSSGTSVYDYATWDRFTPTQKLARLRQEFGIRIERNATNTTNYGYFDPAKSQSKLYITDRGLQSRSMARTTVAHELQHYNDFQNHVVTPIRAGNTPTMTGNAYSNFTEKNAYSLELRMANKYALSMNEWRVSAAGARYYNAWSSSYYNYNFNLLMLLRNIY